MAISGKSAWIDKDNSYCKYGIDDVLAWRRAKPPCHHYFIPDRDGQCCLYCGAVKYKIKGIVK